MLCIISAFVLGLYSTYEREHAAFVYWLVAMRENTHHEKPLGISGRVSGANLLRS
jgi:hypothetical protein